MTKTSSKQGPKKGQGRKLKLNKETLKDLSAPDASGVKGGLFDTVACKTVVLCTGLPCVSKGGASCVPCNSVSCVGGACLAK